MNENDSAHGTERTGSQLGALIGITFFLLFATGVAETLAGLLLRWLS